MARLVEPAVPLDGRALPGGRAFVTGGGLDDASRGVVLLGDSLLVSAGVRELEHTMGARLATLLEQRSATPSGTRVTSYAVTGATSRELAPQLAGLARHRGPVDHVLFSVGANDVSALTSLRRYAAGIDDAIGAARALHPQARIWMAGVPRFANASVLRPALRDTMESRAVAVREVQHSVARRHEATLLPTTNLYEGLPPAAHVAEDGFHPTAAGYEHAARHLVQHGFG